MFELAWTSTHQTPTPARVSKAGKSKLTIAPLPNTFAYLGYRMESGFYRHPCTVPSAPILDEISGSRLDVGVLGALEVNTLELSQS